MMNLKDCFEAMLGRQQRCPTGVVGWAVGERMVRQHVPETVWTISLLHVTPTDRVLEIGFGAGRAIELVAARASAGHVAGIDLSAAMVRVATRRNARAIALGRVALRQGDVAALPYPGDHFDKVLSIHTFYFWADPARALDEILRVLRPGGRLALTLSTGTIGAVRNSALEAYATMLQERVVPGMLRSGFTTASIERGPDSRQYKTVAVIGSK